MKKRVIKLKFVHILIRVICFALMLSLCLAIVILVFFKTLKVTGTRMEPTLYEGEILLAKDLKEYEKGDIIAFYHKDLILIRRVIATEGDIVNINYDGTVYVNSSELNEQYITQKTLGNNCNITFPYQVPENSVFVLGDNREFSIDSRNKEIGSISQDNIIGKIKFKLNPFVIY